MHFSTQRRRSAQQDTTEMDTDRLSVHPQPQPASPAAPATVHSSTLDPAVTGVGAHTARAGGGLAPALSAAPWEADDWPSPPDAAAAEAEGSTLGPQVVTDGALSAPPIGTTALAAATWPVTWATTAASRPSRLEMADAATERPSMLEPALTVGGSVRVPAVCGSMTTAATWPAGRATAANDWSPRRDVAASAAARPSTIGPAVVAGGGLGAPAGGGSAPAAAT